LKNRLWTNWANEKNACGGGEKKGRKDPNNHSQIDQEEKRKGKGGYSLGEQEPSADKHW